MRLRFPTSHRAALLAVLLLAAAACGAPAPRDAGGDVATLDWPAILEQARGQTVTLAMWTGDPLINRFMTGWVSARLLELYGIHLSVVSAQGNQIVAMLMTELEAGKGTSEIDMTWINGETFYQLRQIDALYGPFTDRLPNARLVDYDNPFVNLDFQQPIAGFEAPWGNVQLALIYDSARLDDPPRNRAELAAWVRRHPGRFTFDNSFTGMTFLKSLLIDLAGGPGSLDGPFDEARYQRASAELWAYLNELRPYLWKKGETYPAAVAQLHQLFAVGEVDFTMSNNDGEVDNKVLQGLFPRTARAYVLDGGTIQNSHYLGIVKGARHKAGALVVIDFLESPEAQFEKLKPAVWGDGTILDLARLDPQWRARFADVPERRLAPRRADIQDRALAEPASEYMIRLYEDFRAHVITR